jgi:hypothetical protein
MAAELGEVLFVPASIAANPLEAIVLYDVTPRPLVEFTEKIAPIGGTTEPLPFPFTLILSPVFEAVDVPGTVISTGLASVVIWRPRPGPPKS